MSPRFQLVFREDGKPDRSEWHFKNDHGEPHINGVLIVDGEAYAIRGVEWMLRRDDGHQDDVVRFVCTLVVEPAERDGYGAPERASEL
jgi:hypothetical protein